MYRPIELITVITILALTQTSPALCIPLENQSMMMQYVSPILRNVTNTTDESETQAETCSSPTEEFVSPVHGTPRCCKKCEAGTGMLRLCTDLDDTKCGQCDPGSEFSPIPSATAKCQQCRRCQDLHPLAKTRTPCTPTTNTECECEPGYFMSMANQSCKPCTQCKPNEGVVKPCQWNSDTQCQACPKGFWSALTEDSVKCIPCRTCSDNQILAQECSISSDAVCCPKSNQNCTNSDISIYGHVSNYQNDDSEGPMSDVIEQNQMLPIYCSIMGMIIISLLLYVVYKLWKQREAMHNAKLSETGGLDKILIHPQVVPSSIPVRPPPGGAAGSEYDAEVSIPSLGQTAPASERTIPTRSKLQPITTSAQRKKKGLQHDSGDEKHCLIGNSYHTSLDKEYYEKPMKTLPSNLTGVICYRLAQNGWRELANHSGFSKSELDHLHQLTCDRKAKLSSMEEDLLQRTREAKAVETRGVTDYPTPPDDVIIQAVHVVAKLLERDNMTLSEFHRLLVQAGRTDLTVLLTVDNSVAAQNHTSGSPPNCVDLQV